MHFNASSQVNSVKSVGYVLIGMFCLVIFDAAFLMVDSGLYTPSEEPSPSHLSKRAI